MSCMHMSCMLTYEHANGYLELTTINVPKSMYPELRYANALIFSNHLFLYHKVGSNVLIPAAESGQISTFDWLVEKYKLDPNETAKVKG